MRLKQKEGAPASVSEGDEGSGSWGIIVPPATRLDALRFSMEPGKMVSYAYRTVIRWEWRQGPPETITLIAGPDIVTLTGHGLKRLMDALDETRLKMVCQEGSLSQPPQRTPYILSIQIEEGGR
jgi:hypothetical protein